MKIRRWLVTHGGKSRLHSEVQGTAEALLDVSTKSTPGRHRPPSAHPAWKLGPWEESGASETEQGVCRARLEPAAVQERKGSTPLSKTAEEQCGGALNKPEKPKSQ